MVCLNHLKEATELKRKKKRKKDRNSRIRKGTSQGNGQERTAEKRNQMAISQGIGGSVQSGYRVFFL